MTKENPRNVAASVRQRLQNLGSALQAIDSRFLWSHNGSCPLPLRRD